MKLTLDLITDKLSQISPSIKIVGTDEVLNSQASINCECLKCGYKWTAKWDKLRRGRGCHKCAGTLKLTLQGVIDRLKQISPNIKIASTEYKNNKTPLACECLDCGYKWEASAHTLLSGANCRHCALKRISLKKKYTMDEVERALNKTNADLKVLQRDGNLIVWQCLKCGSTYKTKYGILQQGRKQCEVCRGYKNKPSYSQGEAQDIILAHNSKVTIIGDYKGAQENIKAQCIKCGYIWTPKFSDLRQGSGCPKCISQISQVETDFLNQFEGWQRDREVLGGKELDAYFIDKEFAIEINGLFWHGEAQGKGRDYHLNKTNACESKNIKLFHFFDSELKDKGAVCKSMIDNKLGRAKRLYARQCEVKEISAKQAKEFCEINHMQGSCIDKIRFGLFYKGELMSVMTFGTSRYNKGYEFELLRFCSRVGFIIVGSASKLLRAFEKVYNPKSLISYGNRRWCSKLNNVYAALGFTYEGETMPNYFYTKGSKIYNRQNFQRHKLNKVFDYDFNPVLTEKEIMQLYGYDVVYDCGNLIYTKDY